MTTITDGAETLGTVNTYEVNFQFPNWNYQIVRVEARSATEANELAWKQIDDSNWHEVDEPGDIEVFEIEVGQ